ncbi:MAG: type II secretion system F family protein, partial [Bacteroidetes bacterium]|nr:type II secretion system F family protein [Bacteroidota bacterium]
ILISSGLDILSALELIGDEQTSESRKQLFTKLKEDIISGRSLSSAMHESRKFSPYEYYSLQIGEETGRINVVLQQLSKYYNGRIKQKRQIINALTYPVIVLLTAFGAVWFMMGFMVPMFGDVFKRFGGDLPGLTKNILAFSEFISSYFPLFIFGIVTLIVIAYFQRKQEWYRKYSNRIVLSIPVIGKLLHKIYLGRFCQSMALMTGANMPMLKSIELTSKMIGFYSIERSLENVGDDIIHGKTLHSSLGACTIFPKRMISLVKVGEEVNQLDNMFDRLNDQYSQEVEQQSAMIGSLLEPVMIIFLGLVVGVILVALYLPMFQLSMSFG